MFFITREIDVADLYTETTNKNWFQNIADSFLGIIFGIILFLASFYVLWWNEGRLNPAKIAQQSTPISATTIDPKNNDKFVSVSAPIESSETLGDEWLKPGHFIVLIRNSKMYAWVEKKAETTQKELGGGSTTTTTYSYEKKWTEYPEATSSFKHPEGHENPVMQIKQTKTACKAAKLGAYNVSPSYIPSNSQALIQVPLTPKNTTLKKDEFLSQNYIFKGKGNIEAPELGDIQISYYALEQGSKMTAFGLLQDDKIVPHAYQDEEVFCQIRAGNRNEAIASMSSEFKFTLWVLRGIGFLMMAFGLLLFFGPIFAILDIVPFLGSISKSLFFVFSLLISFVLSTATILISMVLHNIWALMLTILALIVLFLYLFTKRRRKSLTTTAN